MFLSATPHNAVAEDNADDEIRNNTKHYRYGSRRAGISGPALSNMTGRMAA